MNKYCKIVILKDDIYDSFIYKKRLYIVTLQKQIIPIDWVEFIKSITPQRNAFPFVVSFTRSDVLYSPQYKIFINDTILRNDLIDSFSALRNLEFSFDSQKLSKFVPPENLWRRIEELPRDIKCAFNQFYLINDNYVAVSKIKYGSTKSRQCLLSPFYCFAKGNFTSMEFVGRDIFFSSQEKGVYMSAYVDEGQYSKELEVVSNHHASYLTNNFSSLTIGSYFKESHILSTVKDAKYSNRTFDSKSLNELFKCNRYDLIFSFHDKIYCANGNTIKMIRYTNKGRKFSNVIEIPIHLNINDKPLSAEVAVFGLIIEFKNKIIVFPSTEDETISIGNENDSIIGWRIFPHSKDYKNQLHVIFKNRIEIWSFNYDYFINQFEKKIGSRNTNYNKP